MPTELNALGGGGDPVARALDRTVGAALVRVTGELRPKRWLPADLQRIGVMKAIGIGDMILATGVIRDVAAAFPGAEVVVLAGSENEGIARLVENVRVVPLRLAQPWSTVRFLRAARLDVLLDLGQWTRTEAIYSLLSGARYTVGFETPGQRRHYAYDETAPHSPEVHELENFRRVAARIGVEGSSLPRIEPPAAQAEPPVSGPYSVFHLWPGGFFSHLREWPLDSWRELARRLVERGFQILLSGAPADAPRAEAFASSCLELGDAVQSIAGRHDLVRLVSVLRESKCVVSVNTGVMHLAAAAGAPTVALNGPTNDARWGPLGPRVVSLSSSLRGCGYLNLGWEYDGHRTDCMQGISVDRVADAVLELAGG